MREADERVRRINAELDHRPTSTGVKLKLVRQPREDADLTGLADVRKRLLNKISDAWSADDRAAVGAFLQQRIAAERELDAAACAHCMDLIRELDLDFVMTSERESQLTRGHAGRSLPRAPAACTGWRHAERSASKAAPAQGVALRGPPVDALWDAEFGPRMQAAGLAVYE